MSCFSQNQANELLLEKWPQLKNLWCLNKDYWDFIPPQSYTHETIPAGNNWLDYLSDNINQFFNKSCPTPFRWHQEK